MGGSEDTAEPGREPGAGGSGADSSEAGGRMAGLDADHADGRSLVAAITAGVLGAAAAGTAIAFVALQRRNRHQLERDALYLRLLQEPLRGVPVHAVSADGTALFAQLMGPDEAPTIVLVPGWTETLHYFDLLARELLERGFRVVCCDLRGQGESASLAGYDQRIERHGEDLEAQLEACCAGRDDVIVAGHSLGGMAIAAWAAAFDVRRRARAVALMSTGMADLVPGSRLWPLLPSAIRDAAERFALTSEETLPHHSTPVSRALLRYGVFGPDASPGLISFFEQMSWQTAPANRAGAGRTVANLDLRSALARIAVPATVIAGATDRMLPVSQTERMVQALPQLAELLALKRTGHMGPLERPAEIAAALARLAERVGLSPAATSHGD